MRLENNNDIMHFCNVLWLKNNTWLIDVMWLKNNARFSEKEIVAQWRFAVQRNTWLNENELVIQYILWLKTAHNSVTLRD